MTKHRQQGGQIGNGSARTESVIVGAFDDDVAAKPVYQAGNVPIHFF